MYGKSHIAVLSIWSLIPSVLAYTGLPLQIFGKVCRPFPIKVWLPSNSSQGSMFGPYTPLQQLDLLADSGTKSYVVGSTNSLLLQQKDRYSDILINVWHLPLPAS